MSETDTKEYPVMFTPPGTDEGGTPESVELLEAILALEINDDGYMYASFGPKSQENLRRLIQEIKGLRAERDIANGSVGRDLEEIPDDELSDQDFRDKHGL